ncbi:MAG TPA: FAD-binding oxidoreductase [Thermomicrobiales bacterium]|nr:FAD-binding oxidoreductase [Thermomicrobiales bacterium]
MSSSSTDIIVVGGGVVGTSIAWHLARKGASVTLLEERNIAAAASGASAGGVRQQGRDPREMPLAIAAIARWEHLEDELGADLHYYREGHLVAYGHEDDLPVARQRVADQRELGLEIELVEGRDLRELCPGLAEDISIGTYTPTDGHANPTLTTQAFANAARREGAKTMLGVRVTGLAKEGDRIIGVDTEDGVLEADHVILATGAWTRDLVAPLGVDLPIIPTGLQMILSRPMPKQLRQVVGAYGRSLSLKQLREGNYLIGGGWPGDIDMLAGVGTTRPESIAGSRETAAAIYPVLDEMEIERSWVGVEGIAFDEIPVIDGLPGYRSVTVAAGFSGHGFALSPITGQLVAEWVLDGAPSIPLDAFSATRFANLDATQMPTPSAG